MIAGVPYYQACVSVSWFTSKPFAAAVHRPSTGSFRLAPAACLLLNTCQLTCVVPWRRGGFRGALGRVLQHSAFSCSRPHCTRSLLWRSVTVFPALRHMPVSCSSSVGTCCARACGLVCGCVCEGCCIRLPFLGHGRKRPAAMAFWCGAGVFRVRANINCVFSCSPACKLPAGTAVWGFACLAARCMAGGCACMCPGLCAGRVREEVVDHTQRE